MKAVFTSDRYREYLSTMQNFYFYSYCIADRFANLIYMEE